MTTSFAAAAVLDTPAPTPVFHMGGPHQTHTTLAGLTGCDLVRVSLACFTQEKASPVQTWCQVLELPCESDAHGLAQLRRAASHQAPQLAALPAVAPVVPPVKAEVRPGLSTDPLLALAILCRCSNTVFIRDRSPTVSLANLARDIAIVLPLSTKESST